jgi:AraC-like DNA-binding protein
VLSSEVLLDAEGVVVEDVRCPGHSPDWSSDEPVTRFGVVFPRAGVFRRRVDGVESVIDTVSGYVQRPNSEQQIAHPSGGDRCTSVTMSASALVSLVGDDRVSAGRADLALAIDPGVDLRHRELVARAGRGAEADELTERAMAILGGVLTGLAPDAIGAGFPSGAERRRRLMDEVRQALHEEPDLGLTELARRVGLSPFHLSRVFKQACGLTISAYRVRLRVRRALERLGDGERDLARLAVDTGFADQAHLTRRVRSETGDTPGQLRALLARSAV